jgi:hypothetical protein
VGWFFQPAGFDRLRRKTEDNLANSTGDWGDGFVRCGVAVELNTFHRYVYFSTRWFQQVGLCFGPQPVDFDRWRASHTCRIRQVACQHHLSKSTGCGFGGCWDTCPEVSTEVGGCWDTCPHCEHGLKGTPWTCPGHGICGRGISV